MSNTEERTPSPSLLLPDRGYLICCLERTGSTLLAQTLSDTSMAGQPIEYFNPVMQDKPRLRAILGDLQLLEGFEKVLCAGTTPNGVFGAKLHWGHLRFLGMSLQGRWSKAARTMMLDVLRAQLPKLLSESEVASVLDPTFSDLNAQAVALDFLKTHIPGLQFIWLTRQNMLCRALSHFRAMKSDVWFHTVDGKAPQEGGHPLPEFDLGEVHTFYQLGLYQEKSWQAIFAKHGITPHCVVYEELIANREETIRGVLRFLGVNAGVASIPSPRSGRQADEVSEEWERLYRRSMP